MLQKERQLGEINILACADDFVYGCCLRCDYHNRLWRVQTAQILAAGFVGGNAERGGDARAAAAHCRDQLVVLRTGVLEQAGFVGALDRTAQVNESDRLGVDLHFARLDELVHKGPQSEPLEIKRHAGSSGALLKASTRAEKLLELVLAVPDRTPFTPGCAAIPATLRGSPCPP